MFLYSIKVILTLVFLIASGGFTIYGLIYQRQSAKTSRELNIFMPTTIRLMLYLWLGLGFIAILASIGALILVLFFQKSEV